jgi:HD-GYP domain-containing protein (c-di-GMP phosphodiesterase class II)
VVFNTCQGFLGAASGAAVFDAVARAALPSSDESVMWATLLAAAATILANDALVFLVVWAQLGLRFTRMLTDWVRGRADLPYDAVLYAAGFVAAMAGSIHAWLLLLLAVPAPVLYRAMRNQVALRQQTREAVEALADVVDERDPYTFGHCKRVAEYTLALCRELKLAPDLTDEIVLAARVHDVGKIGIRDSVLQKPDRLEQHEYDHIKQHPDIGARLTARFPDFAGGTRYIRHHHEKFDGSGYPAGLAGKDIPLGARIIAVADTYDAMTSTRVYRLGLDEAEVLDEMARVAGSQLDPDVVWGWFAFKGWAIPGDEAEAVAA